MCTQVYRGRLRCNGAEVAVKVQRPGIRSALALDVLLSRLLASTGEILPLPFLPYRRVKIQGRAEG